LVAYGDLGQTVNEQFADVHAAAMLSYSSPGLFNGAAECAAAFGRLSGEVHLTATDASFAINRAQAESGFFDMLTISGSVGPGFIIYDYSIAGSAEGEADAHIFLYHQGDPDEELAGEVTEDGVFTSLVHNFTFGQPFRTGAVLSTIGLIGEGETSETSAHFEAWLSGISVFDSEMRPLAEFSISSESGTTYPLPAPSTGMALAFGGLILRRRRRSAIR
jgi:hypothetical protein